MWNKNGREWWRAAVLHQSCPTYDRHCLWRYDGLSIIVTLQTCGPPRPPENLKSESREREWPSAGCCVCYKSTCQYPTTYWIVCWPSKTSADKTKKKKWVNRTILIKMIKEVPYSWLKGECYGFVFFVIGNKEMYVQMGNIW